MTEAELADPLIDTWLHLCAVPWSWLLPALAALLWTGAAYAWCRRGGVRSTRTHGQDAVRLGIVLTLSSGILTLILLFTARFLPAFAVMGLCFWTATIAVPAMAFHAQLRESQPGWRTSPRSVRLALQLMLWGGPALAVYCCLIEPFRLVDEHHQIRLPGLRRSLRVVHLSDLQSDLFTPREQAVIDRVRGLRPDLIVLTGDYFNATARHNPLGRAAAVEVLQTLRAPLGVFMVTGHMDTAAGHRELAEETGLMLLVNEHRLLDTPAGPIQLVGIDTKTPDVPRAVADLDPTLPVIALSHVPDVVRELQEGPVDLLLAGHTHGGQIALPGFGAFTALSELGRHYASGLFEFGSVELYVNRGIGMEGFMAPPVRFYCPPEIALIELLPES